LVLNLGGKGRFTSSGSCGKRSSLLRYYNLSRHGRNSSNRKKPFNTKSVNRPEKRTALPRFLFNRHRTLLAQVTAPTPTLARTNKAPIRCIFDRSPPPFRPARPKCRPVLVLSYARERPARNRAPPIRQPTGHFRKFPPNARHHGDISIATSRPFHSCWSTHANDPRNRSPTHPNFAHARTRPDVFPVPRPVCYLFFPPSFSWLRFGVNPTARRASLPYFLRDPQKTISTAHSSTTNSLEILFRTQHKAVET
jgi:hypothetical protein